MGISGLSPPWRDQMRCGWLSVLTLNSTSHQMFFATAWKIVAIRNKSTLLLESQVSTRTRPGTNYTPRFTLAMRTRHWSMIDISLRHDNSCSWVSVHPKFPLPLVNLGGESSSVVFKLVLMFSVVVCLKLVIAWAFRQWASIRKAW